LLERETILDLKNPAEKAQEIIIFGSLCFVAHPKNRHFWNADNGIYVVD